MTRWIVLQLADSAFPAGGFAHSMGLEAAVAMGEVRGGPGVARFAEAMLWQAGMTALSVVRAACAAPARLGELDARCEAFLTSHVANRASRTQGRALAATCARSFGGARLEAIAAAARRGEIAGHLAPVFGAAAAALDVTREEAGALWLHGAVRTVLSAGVRLGVIGPHEAQGVQRGLAEVCERVLREGDGEGEGNEVDEIASVMPVADVIGGMHDRMYSRLFQS
jgi:urease accessory protein